MPLYFSNIDPNPAAAQSQSKLSIYQLVYHF